MAQYTAIFTKPYADGYENLPSQNTPITAQTLNDKDNAIVNIETYLSGNDIPSDAEGLSYDNTDSGLNATDVQSAIDEIVTDIPTTAEDIGYDNTDSGLTADDVQEAIDEIVSDIPTVNNGTLTIQKNGTDVATFSANQSSNATANIQVVEPDSTIKTNTTGQFNTITGGLMESCVVTVEPVQSGSGTPSPDNVRPITGHSSVEVENVGKNKLQNTRTGTTEQNGLKITSNSDGSVFFHGGYTANALSSYDLSTTQDIPNGSYILNGCPSGGGGSTFQISINDKNDTDLTNSFTDTGSGANVTISNGGVYRPRVIIRQGYTIPSGGLLFKPMLRLATDIDSTFEPYLGKTYTISLGQTVYGGTLDVVNGSGSDEWVNIASYNGETITEPWLSSMDEYTSGGTPTTGAQVVYKKATATSFSTTPTQIETLIGQNNVSVPLTGQSLDSLSYREVLAWDDVERAINVKLDLSSVAPIEYTDKASQSYNQKQLFIKDNKLCQALASISSGASFTENTNFKYTTLAEIIEPLL